MNSLRFFLLGVIVIHYLSAKVRGTLSRALDMLQTLLRTLFPCRAPEDFGPCVSVRSVTCSLNSLLSTPCLIIRSYSFSAICLRGRFSTNRDREIWEVRWKRFWVTTVEPAYKDMFRTGGLIREVEAFTRKSAYQDTPVLRAALSYLVKALT
jgi:hypothetical protein